MIVICPDETNKKQLVAGFNSCKNRTIVTSGRWLAQASWVVNVCCLGERNVHSDASEFCGPRTEPPKAIVLIESHVNRIPVFFVPLALGLCFGTDSVSAQTDQTWNGGNGSWNFGANWSNGTVPTGVIDNALIDGGNSVSSVVQFDEGDQIAIGSLSIDSDDSLILVDNSRLEILTDSATNPDSGRIRNAGQIQFNSSIGASLRFEQALTLNGGGTVVLNQGADISGSDTIFGQLINQDNTIQGTGSIGLFNPVLLTNQADGVIDANVSGKTLNLFPSPTYVISPNEIDVVNHGTFRASNGGSLIISSPYKVRIDNTGGLIEAIDGGQINTQVAELELFGGTLRVESGSELLMPGSSLTDMTIEGTGTVNGGRQLENLITRGSLQINSGDVSISGTIDSRGELTIDSRDVRLSNLTTHGSVSIDSLETTLAGQIDNRGMLDFTNTTGRVFIEDEVEITGGGTIRLSSPDSPQFRGVEISSARGGAHLINGGGSTISGIADIGDGDLAITNQAGSVIDANIAPQDDQAPIPKSIRLLPNQDGVVNRGTLRASGGGVLFLEGEIDNVSGVIEAIDGGRVGNDSRHTEISGGTVRARTGGEFRFGRRGASISDAIVDITGDIHSLGDLSLTDVTNQGDLGLDASETRLSGQIVNQSTLTVLDNEGLVTHDEVTLTGGGTLRLRGDSFVQVVAGNLVGAHLTNSAHTISGSGGIITDITNQSGGVIDANVAGPANQSSFDTVLALRKDSVGIVNQGIIRASNSGTLAFLSAEHDLIKIDNQGGIIEAVEGSLVYAVNKIPAIPQFRGGAVDITGGTLRTRSGGRIGLFGRLSNLKIDGTVHALGDVTLDGEIENLGEINLGGFDGSTGAAAIVAGDVTLSGGGTVDLRHGMIRGDRTGQSELNNVDNTIKGAGQIGDGNLKFTNGASGYVISVDEAPLQIQAEVTNLGVFQVDSGSRMEIDGPMTNSTLGSIVRNGTFQSNETIVNEGRIAPGASVGELQMEASLTFTQSAIFEIEIDASGADLLTVFQGNVNLDGDLQINVLANYTPSESDVFDILNVVGPGPGMLDGTFAGIDDGDRAVIRNGGGSFVVHYDYGIGRVWLSSFVAVPEPGSSVLLGTLAIAFVGRPRRRRRSAGQCR